MIKSTRAEGTRGMTNLAILVSRHVFVEKGGNRFAARRNTVTRIAPSCQHSRVGVVDAKCGGETLGAMAHAAI